MVLSVGERDLRVPWSGSRSRLDRHWTEPVLRSDRTCRGDRSQGAFHGEPIQFGSLLGGFCAMSCSGTRIAGLRRMPIDPSVIHAGRSAGQRGRRQPVVRMSWQPIDPVWIHSAGAYLPLTCHIVIPINKEGSPSRATPPLKSYGKNQVSLLRPSRRATFRAAHAG